MACEPQQVVENATFGFRAAGPALLSNLSYSTPDLRVGSGEHEDQGRGQGIIGRCQLRSST
jgi:hypothetical protein